MSRILELIKTVPRLIGLVFKACGLIGIGILLFFSGFFITSPTFFSIPVLVWVSLIILFIWWLSNEN
jgi:hypothetical protein